MCKKTVDQCRTGADFVEFAPPHGGEIVRQTGSHVIVKGPKGQTVVPNHKHDLGKGLRMKLVKQFRLIGLVAMLVAALAVMW